MSAKFESLVKALSDVIKSPNKDTEPFDTVATVTRIDGDTAFVHMPGGVAETPVSLTISCKEGDSVQVRVGGGKAWLVGNASAPPTDDTTAKTAIRKTGVLGDQLTKVQKIAGNTNQYFWHTETGDDTGSHITEIPQERFLASPGNGGGNLLLRSNGIAIRNGLSELATFSSTAIQFNKPGTNTVVATIGTSGLYIQKGVIKIGSKTSASDASNSGFYVDVNGNVACSNLLAHGGKIGGWTIGTNGLTSYTLNGTPTEYANADRGVYLGNGTNAAQDAFLVTRKINGSWTYPVILRADGYFRLAYGLQSLTFDPSATNTLSITGHLTASSGKIGGWNIEQNALRSYTLNGAASDCTNADNYVYFGNGTNPNQDALVVANKINGTWTWPVVLRADGYFNLSYGGQSLTFNPAATNALSVNGHITSSSGTIGGWTLSSSGLYYPSVTTQNAYVTGTAAKFGNGTGYVRIGNFGGVWGMDSSEDYAMTIGNCVTWIVLGVNGEWVRPDDSGAQNLGTSDYKWKNIYATNGTIQTSDAKDKDVIGELDDELASNLILNSKPITYMWKDGDHRRTRMGFVAQDIVKTCKSMDKNLALFTASYKVDPELGDDDPNMVRDYFGEDVDDEELTWGLAYNELIAPLVKVVQMQHDNTQQLMNRLSELEARLNG